MGWSNSSGFHWFQTLNSLSSPEPPWVCFLPAPTSVSLILALTTPPSYALSHPSEVYCTKWKMWIVCHSQKCWSCHNVKQCYCLDLTITTHPICNIHCSVCIFVWRWTRNIFAQRRCFLSTNVFCVHFSAKKKLVPLSGTERETADEWKAAVYWEKQLWETLEVPRKTVNHLWLYVTACACETVNK